MLPPGKTGDSGSSEVPQPGGVGAAGPGRALPGHSPIPIPVPAWSSRAPPGGSSGQGNPAAAGGDGGA